MFRPPLYILGILLALASKLSASLVIVDFESLEDTATLPGSQFRFHGTSYSEDGFTLETETGFATTTTDFTLVFPGSTSLLIGTSADTAKLFQASKKPFDLLSIDVAAFYLGSPSSGPAPFSIEFIATFEDASTLGQIHSIPAATPSAQTLDTFLFSGFEKVVSVQWTQGPDYFHQFDNIRLNTDSPIQSVPEPSTYGLLAATFLAFLIWRRNRQK